MHKILIFPAFKRFQFASKNAIHTELEANCTELTFDLSNLENRVFPNPRKSRTVYMNCETVHKNKLKLLQRSPTKCSNGKKNQIVLNTHTTVHQIHHSHPFGCQMPNVVHRVTRNTDLSVFLPIFYTYAYRFTDDRPKTTDFSFILPKITDIWFFSRLGLISTYDKIVSDIALQRL